jgi:hypothetical protein
MHQNHLEIPDSQLPIHTLRKRTGMEIVACGEFWLCHLQAAWPQGQKPALRPHFLPARLESENSQHQIPRWPSLTTLAK